MVGLEIGCDQLELVFEKKKNYSRNWFLVCSKKIIIQILVPNSETPEIIRILEMLFIFSIFLEFLTILFISFNLQ